ncbi:MAG: thioredoxin domain-containing protein [Desulfobacterales bacterium]|nr:thioredoxin domain-containing protein [Desulfobacterales bacterium]
MLPEVSIPTNAVIVVSLFGLAVAVLSALETKVKWIAAFCARFGDGCRQTADYTMLGFPISWWGGVYYILLIGATATVRPLVFWLVFAGLGFELTFVYILVVIRAFCVFCFLNAFVVAVLVAVVFEPAAFWPALATTLAVFIASYFLIWRENRSRLAPETESVGKQPNVLAEIDGKSVMAEEVERPISDKLYELETGIYRMKKERLEKVVRDRLLKLEAERQGRTVRQLAEEVTEDAEKDKRQQALREYAEGLKEVHNVTIHLEKPEPRRFSIVSEDGSPAAGPEDAPVMVAEFSDYKCPACRAGKDEVRKVKEHYQDRVRWVFKNFPLPQHEGADKMALAAHCAEEQGAFWEYHERLFSEVEESDTGTLLNAAEGIDLDVEKFRRCLEEERHRDRIRRDWEAGRQAGVTATPTFIINGSLLSGKPSFEEFSEMIEEELESAKNQ